MKYIMLFSYRFPDEMAMLKFPKVKNILWDHDSTGDDVHLSLSYYRYIKL